VIYLLYFIHIVISLFLILVVLLQQGKGADLSVFGGGASQAAFGARSGTTLLHKLTVGAFIGFIVTTMAIGFVQTEGKGTSVMKSVVNQELQEETGTATKPAKSERPAAKAPAPAQKPAATKSENKGAGDGGGQPK